MLPNLKMKKKWKNMTSIMKIQLSYQKRQNFKNLDTVFNEDNYAVLPPETVVNSSIVAPRKPSISPGIALAIKMHSE